MSLTNLPPEQLSRYRGHLSLCEIDLPGQQAIADGRVLIIGAGGLGSPVALYLAAAGVGKIGILDSDTVSLSNLQRQVIHTTADLGRRKVLSASEKAKAINPHVHVESMDEMLTTTNARGIISDYDIAVDCTDNLSTRLLINDTCVALGKSLVYGAVSRFSGQVFTHVQGSACYRCIFGPAPVENDEPPCSVNGILNTVVGITGCIQASETIKLLTGTGDLLTNRLLVFDALKMTFNSFDVKAIDGCRCQPR